MGKAATKEAAKRVPFNWGKLLAMWNAGKSYLEMAKALDSHYNPDGDDPTKSVRAKCSVGMSKGVKIDGKLVRFARRDKNKKKALEPKKAPAKKVSKGTAKKSKPKATPKAPVVAKTEESKPQPEA